MCVCGVGGRACVRGSRHAAEEVRRMPDEPTDASGGGRANRCREEPASQQQLGTVGCVICNKCVCVGGVGVGGVWEEGGGRNVGRFGHVVQVNACAIK